MLFVPTSKLHAASTNLVPVADTTLHEAFPNNNFGSGASFAAGGRAQGGRARALLRFDIAASIPANATISSASLKLQVSHVNGPGSNLLLHRVTLPWGEGAGNDLGEGTLAAAGEASWMNRLGPGTPWITAGGDFAAATNASQAIAGIGAYTFSSLELATDVQSWLNAPANNHGWLLRSEAEASASTIRRFVGRLDLLTPPLLAVDYSVPATPLPNPPLLTNLELINYAIRFSFVAESNHTYTVQFRNALGNGNWETLTNLPALAAETSWYITNAVTSDERYYRVLSP